MDNHNRFSGRSNEFVPRGGGRNNNGPWFGGNRNYGRGRGRGRGRWGGRRPDHRSGRGRNNRNNNSNSRKGRGDLHYRRSAFDPIEEIGDTVFCSPCGGGDSNTKPSLSSSLVRIAVEGCCHGELDLIYDRLLDHQRTSGHAIDLLVCCGDFQSLRSPADYHSSSIPPKYRRLGTFAKYYSGEKVAPILTVFIGGNHEASQPLRELHYGGFVAPKIYYLGAAGVVRYRGIRIAGISGIYKSHDYVCGYHEVAPYSDRRSVKSVYHVRRIDVERMKLLSRGNNDDSSNNNSKHTIDVFASHDWPLGIEQHGDTQGLIRRKPFFRREIERNELGSPPNRELLDVLKPTHWFAAHLHVKFHATLVHRTQEPATLARKNDQTNPTPQTQVSTTPPTSSVLMPSQVRSKPVISAPPLLLPPPPPVNVANKMASIPFDENNASDTDTSTNVKTDTEADVDGTAATASVPSSTTEFHAMEGSEATCKLGNDSIPDLTEQMTRFLALDKCLPRRQFLSVLNVRLLDTDGSGEGNELSSQLPDERSGTTIDQHPNNPGDASSSDIEATATMCGAPTQVQPQEEPSTSEEYHLEYDPEWLAILKQTHHWNTTERGPVSVPSFNHSNAHYDASWVRNRFKKTNFENQNKPAKEDLPSLASATPNEKKAQQDERGAARAVDSKSNSARQKTPYLEIPRDFVPTVPYYTNEAFRGGKSGSTTDPPSLPAMGNPQTDHLLRVLELQHILTRPYDPALTPDVISAQWRDRTSKRRTIGGSIYAYNNASTSIRGRSSVHNNGNPSNRTIILDDENEIDIDDDEDTAKEEIDDNEIQLEDSDDHDDDGADSNWDRDNNGKGSSKEAEKDEGDENEIDLDSSEGDNADSDNNGDSIETNTAVFKKARLEN